MEPTWKEYRIFAVVGVAALVFLSGLIQLWAIPQPLSWWRFVIPSLAYMGLLALLWRHLRKPR